MSFKGKQSWFCSSPSAPVLETVLLSTEKEPASIVAARLAWARSLPELFTLCVVLIWGEQEPGIGRLDWGRLWAALGVDT